MSLEGEFEKAMRSALEEAAELGYYATLFLEKMNRIGAVQYAKELIVSSDLQSGLKRLAEMRRPDLSIEHLVANCPRFSSLFSSDEVESAQWRLEQVSIE